MGFREKINQNPALMGVAAVVVVLAAGWFLYTSMQPKNQPKTRTQAFFTVDEGKNLFADDINRIVPFQKDGKEAVRAMVYSCDGGKTTFVGYLQKYTPEYVKVLEKQQAEAAKLIAEGKPAPASGGAAEAFGTLLKKPGQGEWMPSAGPGAAIAEVPCPPGATGQLEMQYP